MSASVSELSPYLTGPYAPIEREIEGDALPVAGEIPLDLEGVFVRNGPNPRFAPKGRYHWFDGDGMLHAVELRGGKARYRNRYVKTAHLGREVEAGRPLWSGVMESIRDNPPDSAYKNTANTDLVCFGGELLALWYVSGAPYRLDPVSLETKGPAQAAGADLKMAAHAKVDPRTGELSFFHFGFEPPFLHHGVLSADRARVDLAPVPLPAPRLPHDHAITENYAILMDLPVVYDVAALKRQRWVTRFDRALPSRFAIVPRGGRDRGREVRWFEAEPCYIYHSINAWEEGREIVMTACRVDDPIPEPDPADGPWAQMIANLRVRARFCRWRFDLDTGRTREETIDDLNSEFPMMDVRRRGARSRFSYHVRISPDHLLLFDGLVKYDADTGAREVVELPAGAFASEAPFAPRTGGVDEDDGYVLSFVDDRGTDRSELWIMDARRFGAGPIAKVALPQRVPLGFHGCFVPGVELAGAR